MCRSRSGSTLALTRTRLRTSKEVSVSLSSSSLDSLCSAGEGLFKFLDGVLNRCLDEESALWERDATGLPLGSRNLLADADRGKDVVPFSAALADGDRDRCAGFVWTTLRICGFLAWREKAPPFWR